MADFKKNNRFTHSARKPFDRGDSRPSFRGAPSRGRDFGGEREMFDAECASCHKMTQVPFKPNGMKPVYCRDCFTPENDRNERGPARFEKREFGPKRSFAPRAPQADSGMADVKRQLETMNATLEKIAGMLEKSSRASALTQEMQKYQTPEAKKPKKAVKKVRPSKK